jgi:hypothetical protein
MTRIARILGVREWVLRSGAAEGADAAFEAGADDVGGPKEIYVPWVGFQNHASRLIPSPAAFEAAQPLHPVWAKLSSGARKLHARNVHQVLGRDLNQPSHMVVCWTKGGAEVGGTAMAIRIAKTANVPVWNLGLGAVRDKFEFWVREREAAGAALN